MNTIVHTQQKSRTTCIFPFFQTLQNKHVICTKCLLTLTIYYNVSLSRSKITCELYNTHKSPIEIMELIQKLVIFRNKICLKTKKLTHTSVELRLHITP